MKQFSFLSNSERKVTVTCQNWCRYEKVLWNYSF